MKRGSTNATFGSVPAAQSAKKPATGLEIDMYFDLHSARNGTSL